MVFFSVVIPTYNRAKLLRQALESVFVQSFKNYEVIVVDDGSEDDTANVLAGYGSKIRVLRQKNAGPGSARNAGADIALGDYLAFLDSDDVWFSWTLATFAVAIQRHGQPAIVSGRIVEFQRISETLAVRRTDLHAEGFLDYFETSERGYFVSSGNAVIKTAAFKGSAGFPKERINGEDHDLTMRMGTDAGFVQILQPVTVGYRRHVKSETMDTTKTMAGAVYLLRRESCNAYPGGSVRSSERRRILTMHIRPVSLALLLNREYAKALRLYIQTFGWHVKLGRWRYLFGFPFCLVAALLPQRRRPIHMQGVSTPDGRST